MDLTDRLIHRDEQHAAPVGRWPALAFAAGAVAGLVVMLGTAAAWIETETPADRPMLGRLVVTVVGKPLVVRESTDFPGLERQLSTFSWGLIAAGMAGGGLAGLAGVAGARRAFFAALGPDGRV